MRGLLLLLAGLLAAGCLSAETLAANARHETMLETQCPEAQIAIRDYRTGAAGIIPSTWKASGCGKEWECQLWVPGAMSGGPVPPTTRCREVVR